MNPDLSFAEKSLGNQEITFINKWLKGPKRTHCFARETLGPDRTYLGLRRGKLRNRLIYTPACTHHEV